MECVTAHAPVRWFHLEESKSERSTIMRIDGTVMVSKLTPMSHPVALATDDPPPTGKGPRLKSHSIGAMPEAPNVPLTSGSACSVPEFHFAWLSPWSSTRRS